MTRHARPASPPPRRWPAGSGHPPPPAPCRWPRIRRPSGSAARSRPGPAPSRDGGRCRAAPARSHRTAVAGDDRCRGVFHRRDRTAAGGEQCRALGRQPGHQHGAGHRIRHRQAAPLVAQIEDCADRLADRLGVAQADQPFGDRVDHAHPPGRIGGHHALADGAQGARKPSSLWRRRLSMACLTGPPRWKRGCRRAGRASADSPGAPWRGPGAGSRHR